MLQSTGAFPRRMSHKQRRLAPTGPLLVLVLQTSLTPKGPLLVPLLPPRMLNLWSDLLRTTGLPAAGIGAIQTLHPYLAIQSVAEHAWCSGSCPAQHASQCWVQLRAWREVCSEATRAVYYSEVGGGHCNYTCAGFVEFDTFFLRETPGHGQATIQ